MPKAAKRLPPSDSKSRGTRDSPSSWRGYAVGFERYPADVDLAPFFAGLPDDRCQCPHWGYVIHGKVTVPVGRSGIRREFRLDDASDGTRRRNLS